MEDVGLNIPLLDVEKISVLAIYGVDIIFDIKIKFLESNKEINDKSVKLEGSEDLRIGSFYMDINEFS